MEVTGVDWFFRIFFSILMIGGFIYFLIRKKHKHYPPPASSGDLLKYDSYLEADRKAREAKYRPTGFIFGKDVHLKHWLTKPEDKDGHILIMGGTGSGKSSCLVIPSIMCWEGRIFAVDIKGELREKADRGTIKVFNPLDENACSYDPFYIMKTSRNVVSDISQIALSLIPVAEGDEEIWRDSARNLLSAGLIHYYYQDYSFIKAIEKIQITPIVELVKELMESEAPKVAVYRKSLVDLIQGKASKTLASVSFQLSNHIIDFVVDDDIIRAFTPDVKSIKPTDLDHGYDVFLQIPEDKLKQWGKILGLISAQFISYFRRRPEGSKKPILFLLDEFPALGKIEDMTGALSTLRSKNITIALVCQSLSQLIENYGVNNSTTIINNCLYRAILNATDRDTQKLFSDLVGTHEVMRETASESTNKNPIGRIENDGGWFGPGYKEYTTTTSSSSSKSYSYQEKQIIKPEEFAYLKDIVLLTPDGFFRVTKMPYYSTKEYYNTERLFANFDLEDLEEKKPKYEKNLFFSAQIIGEKEDEKYKVIVWSDNDEIERAEEIIELWNFYEYEKKLADFAEENELELVEVEES